MPSESFLKLQTYLKDIFQYNDNDLDFGIYKLLKLKRREIEHFVDGNEDGCLQKIVETTLSENQSADLKQYEETILSFIDENIPKRQQHNYKENLRERLNDIKTLIRDNSTDYLPQEERTITACDALLNHKTDSGLEDQIYNYIINFFELYYNNGDFGYNDRSLAQFKVEYDEDYDGSDILFHWKHKDSYYIKSGNDFTNITFELQDKKIEYRVEGFDSTATTSQNNNKDSKLKHYKFKEIKRINGTYKVIFSLSDKSTSKAEVFAQILSEVFGMTNTEKYLSSKDDKPAFNDLTDKYEKIINGQIQGLKKLQLTKEEYCKRLVANDQFDDLGTNDSKRIEALQNDPTIELIYTLDKNLNKFYIGNDSDFFIHKDLKKFLTKEKEKFIKNVIFSSINALFYSDGNSNTKLIAKSFNNVVDKIIEFLDAIESFQRNLFLLKKKVVQTDYLISIDKIPAEFHKEILENTAQMKEFHATFNLDVQANLFQLSHYPTLVIDSKYFSEDFKERLFSHKDFEDLENKITGLLVNSENFQALNLLLEKYRHKIKCVYLDPPYNTSKDTFIYKDNFKHSSWLSFVLNRLEISNSFLMDNGIVMISLDENEYSNLKSSMKELDYIGTIIIKTATDNNPTQINIEHEYIQFYAKNINSLDKWAEKSFAAELILTKYIELKEKYNTDIERIQADLRDWIKTNKELLPKVTHYDNVDKKGVFHDGDVANTIFGGYEYDVIHPVSEKPCKIPEKGYRFKETTMAQMLDNDDILFGEDESTLIKPKIRLENVKDLLRSVIYEDGRASTKMLESIFYKDVFDNPKSINILSRLFSFPMEENDYVLDYYGGSGTTAHSIIKLNKEKDSISDRRFILIEAEEYFRTVMKERIKRVMFSEYWKDGKPKLDQIDGYSCIVKYIRLEQYEDVLNNLKAEGEALPKNIPLKYLFRPQEKAIRSTLDLSKPFDNKIIYGKENIEGNVDLCETYIYLKGYKVNSVKVYNNHRKKYKVYHTDNRLVIWRNINLEEDDSSFIKEVIGKYENIDAIDVNYYIDRRRIKTPKPFIITNEDFDVNATWS